MPRLRITASLSVLALLIGVAGTAWLSTLTAAWHAPSARDMATAHARPAPRNPALRGHGAVHLVQPRRARPVRAAVDSGTAQAATIERPDILQPVSTPADTSQTWEQLRGHLDGQMVMRVRIAADGRVAAASVAESSGDPVLDEHALRSVHRWRFAVPADHPDGLSGNLPMRFSSRDRGPGMR